MGTKIATLKTQKLWDGIILGLVFHTDIILLISLMNVMRRRLTKVLRLTIADAQTLVKSFVQGRECDIITIHALSLVILKLVSPSFQ